MAKSETSHIAILKKEFVMASNQHIDRSLRYLLANLRKCII